MKIKDAKWEMIDDEIGMKPKFQVICTQCFWNWVKEEVMAIFAKGRIDDAIEDVFAVGLHKMMDGDFDMSLREVHCTPLESVGNRAFANNMHYKCCKSDGCDQIQVFGVPIDAEYYSRLVVRRKGLNRILPRKQWDKDEDLKKQLEGLGYL